MGIRSGKASGVNVMLLIAQIALGVIIGGLTIALLVTGFFVWNSRQRNERLAVGLFMVLKSYAPDDKSFSWPNPATVSPISKPRRRIVIRGKVVQLAVRP